MKLTKKLLATALFGASVFSFHSTAWADTQEQQFQQGFEATTRGDYKIAFKLWLPLAEQGYASAQFNLGLMYSKGRGVKQDDFEANKGAFVSADIVLMIHTLKAGELDKYEVEHISRLLHASKNDNKLLVLTQIDQITEEQQKAVVNRIKEQLPKFEPILVSATRYLKGVAESKDKLVELSGVPELKSKIQNLKSTIAQQRNKEVNELQQLLNHLLEEGSSSINNKLSALNKAQNDKRNKFERKLNQIFNTF